MINPLRYKWIVAKPDFVVRGCKMEVGTVFSPRLLHRRIWNKYIDSGFIVEESEYLQSKEEAVAAPEKPVQAVSEAVDSEPKVEEKAPQEPSEKPKAKPKAKPKKKPVKKVKKDA